MKIDPPKTFRGMWSRFDRQNAAFAAASIPLRRVMLAEDVLLLVRSGALRSTWGTYGVLNLYDSYTGPEPMVRDLLKKDTNCEVCALGRAGIWRWDAMSPDTRQPFEDLGLDEATYVRLPDNQLRLRAIMQTIIDDPVAKYPRVDLFVANLKRLAHE